jgi:hypothetical protein
MVYSDEKEKRRQKNIKKRVMVKINKDQKSEKVVEGDTYSANQT